MAGTEDTDEPLAREGEHVPPAFRKNAYHCPRCGVLTAQDWRQLSMPGIGVVPVWWVRCTTCEQAQLWMGSDVENAAMLWPAATLGPRPHIDMPEDVRKDYEEARSILQQSPRGACALNRLALQKLVDGLEPGNASLNDKIGTLVKKGLSDTVQQALDALRVFGNNAVHPGELRLDDDVETATALFECMNMIVEDRVAKPKRMKKLFDRLPQGAKDAIAKRDGAATT